MFNLFILAAAVAMFMVAMTSLTELSIVQAGMLRLRLRQDRKQRALQLAENATKINRGDRPLCVEQLIGLPDRKENDEWLYFVGSDSGYRITFKQNRVYVVHHWLTV